MATRKKKPANNPALAGRFTKAYKAHQASKKVLPNTDDPLDTAAKEKTQRARGIPT
jgi:hypothetical protein